MSGMFRSGILPLHFWHLNRTHKHCKSGLKLFQGTPSHIFISEKIVLKNIATVSIQFVCLIDL